MAPLLQRVRPTWHNKGETLCSPASGPRAVHLVLAGRLRIHVVTPDGRRVIMEMIGPGGIDGLIRTLGIGGHFTEVVERALVASLSPVQFDRVVRAEPTVAVNVVGLLARRLAAREHQLEALAVRDPGRRIAAQLLHQARSSGERDPGREVVRLRKGLTHQVLADMSGIRRETVTVHMHRLVDTGAVTARAGQLVVDPQLLGRIVAGEVKLGCPRPGRPAQPGPQQSEQRQRGLGRAL